MTKIASSVPAGGVRDVAGHGASPASNAASPVVVASGGPVETVSMSQEAQSVARLFAAAQQAEGVDEAAVRRIKEKLAAGSYNVPAHDLAKAIISVLKEMNS
ncbi:flagellar biosynthesis anti-sigma factor FlgM [Acidocella sp.]|uniref:flagellar biosynthesis anti-sigma factor FlgM n=1 Tax=Acidocella sp. TaxID=50710 RepID=UPI0026336D2F|nr:flagellar biosynthesis anti-sigma factor FlgM [Acidocella sp.]